MILEWGQKSMTLLYGWFFVHIIYVVRTESSRFRWTCITHPKSTFPCQIFSHILILLITWQFCLWSAHWAVTQKSFVLPFLKAVDLAKRFCDGSAPRIVNGCLRTFVKDLEIAKDARVNQSVFTWIFQDQDLDESSKSYILTYMRHFFWAFLCKVMRRDPQCLEIQLPVQICALIQYKEELYIKMLTLPIVKCMVNIIMSML